MFKLQSTKFVAALLWLLGGLTLGAAAVADAPAAPKATTQEPIPIPVWTIEDVASSGYDNALAVDAGDRAHLLYVDPVSGVLRYAARQHDGWHDEDVADESADRPLLAFDLAIRPDISETPCLVYATEQSQPSQPFDTKLVYGCRGPSGWELATIDDGGRAAQLRFNSFGEPGIALIQGRNVVYLSWDNDHWRKEIAGADSDYLNDAYFMLDSGGWPTIVYRGVHGQFQAIRDGDGTWSATPLTVASIYAAELDTVDQLWLAVNDGEAAWGHPPFFLARLKLVEPTDSGPADWETIDEGYDWPIAVDLSFDNSGIPHLAYLDPDGALQVVWWAEDGEHRHAPGARGNSAVSLAFGDGQPRIAFAEDNQLRLATRQLVWLDNWLYAPVIARGE